MFQPNKNTLKANQVFGLNFNLGEVWKIKYEVKWSLSLKFEHDLEIYN